MLAMRLKAAKYVVLALDPAPSAAGYGVATPTKLDPGLYIVDVTAPIFLRDAASGDTTLRASGTVPLEVRLEPGVSKLVPIRLEGDVVISSQDGRACVVHFIPLEVLEP